MLLALRAPAAVTPRPLEAGPAMPSLDLPNLDLPRRGSHGTPLQGLVPPPSVGQADGRRDLDAVRAVVAQRTASGDVWARALDKEGATTVWKQLAARVAGDPAVAQALIGAAQRAAAMQGAIGKRAVDRARPFVVDPEIRVIGRLPKDQSFPSIHSARAFAAARILGELDPALAVDAWAMAREVAISRVYAGVHFPTDVAAGARLGLAMADSVLERWRAGKLDGVLTAA